MNIVEVIISSATLLIPNPQPGPARISVDKYHRMIEAGILTKDDRIELVEGWMIPKMPNSPSHATTAQVIAQQLSRLLQSGWSIGVQSPVTTEDSEPEPDGCVARGDLQDYLTRHPTSGDVGFIVEVSYSSLGFDRNVKARVYARAGFPVYWIANLDDQKIEVLSEPNTGSADPRYQSAKTYSKGQSISFEMDGKSIAQIPVADLLP